MTLLIPLLLRLTSLFERGSVVNDDLTEHQADSEEQTAITLKER